MGITHMATITRTVTTGRIPIMATIRGRHTIGTADIGIITATIVTTIIITGTKVT
jgi:hypothetical protein